MRTVSHSLCLVFPAYVVISHQRISRNGWIHLLEFQHLASSNNFLASILTSGS